MNKRLLSILSAILIMGTISCGNQQASSLETIETSSSSEQEGVSEMTNLEFFKSLNYDNGLEVVTSIFNRFPMQYATYKGLDDGTPMIRPIEFKFEQDGKLYFDTVIFYTSYSELLAYPYISICIGDQETMTYLTVKGKVNFTSDADIIQKCFDASPVLTSQFGKYPQYVIAYYLSEVNVEFSTFSTEFSSHKYYWD